MVCLEHDKRSSLEYTLKIADPDDDILSLLRAGIEQSPFSGFPISDNQLRATILDYTVNTDSKIFLLLCYEGKPIGLLMGFVGYSHPMLINMKVAMEILFYVEPGYRGKHSWNLADAFEYWAKHVMKADIVAMGSLADRDSRAIEVMYKRRGFKPVEKCFIKDLRK